MLAAASVTIEDTSPPANTVYLPCMVTALSTTAITFTVSEGNYSTDAIDVAPTFTDQTVMIQLMGY